jgi:hypothetical protein
MSTAKKVAPEVTTKRPRGRPRKHDNLIVEVIDQYFEGDRDRAAAAWEITRNYLDAIICGAHPLSTGLAARIYLSTEKKVSLESLLALASK